MCANTAFSASNPFAANDGAGGDRDTAIAPKSTPQTRVMPVDKTKPKTSTKTKDVPGKTVKPDVVTPRDEDDTRGRDKYFRINSEGYLIIGNNTYRLRGITGTLMVGGLCTITVSGDVSRRFNGRWSGSPDKPAITITSGNIGARVDGRGSATISGLNASFIGFAGSVGNDYYRVKMPVGPGEGGYWLNGKWQDNRDGSQELSNPPDRPVNEGAVVVPADYWTGACKGSLEAYATDYYSVLSDFILDARLSDRVSLTISNRRTGDRWTIWGIFRSRAGNTWELEPYLLNNTTIDSGRWWIEFTAFRRKVGRMEITGDTSRGAFRVGLQQTTR